jgi:ribosomal protein L11 methylase PrmA
LAVVDEDGVPDDAAPMTRPGVARVQELMRLGEQEAWSLAALALVLQAESSPALLSAAEAVLAAHDLDAVTDLTDLDRRLAAGQAAAPLLQTARLVSGDAPGWQDQSDEALLAQGRASGQAAAAFKTFMLPAMTGLAEALSQPGARMLDVGTGTGALAVAYAERSRR